MEGAEIDAIDGANGVPNLLFLYEDFPRHSMRVTANVLQRGMSVFGVAPTGECTRIGSVEEAISFNVRTAKSGIPSNLVACHPKRAVRLQEELLSGCEARVVQHLRDSR